MGVFNINKVQEWNAENMRKYKIFVNEKFENTEVLMNLMLLDKQLQDLKSNYLLIRAIRDTETDFNKMVDDLKKSFKVIHKKYDNMIK